MRAANAVDSRHAYWPHAVKTMTEKYRKSADWVIGGDYNDETREQRLHGVAARRLRSRCRQRTSRPARSATSSRRESLIDHIFLSPNLAKRAGDDSYFIVAKDKSVDNYARKLSDHRPVLVRISLSAIGIAEQAAPRDVDDEIAGLLQGSAQAA